MQAKLQNGIFYLDSPAIGNSCHIVLIRTGTGSNATEIGEVLVKLWSMLKDLEKGIVNDLRGIAQRNLHPGNLSVLIGYGPEIFLSSNVKKQKPLELNDEVVFKVPSISGGGPILQNSDILYSNDIVKNNASLDHVILQFVGDNEFITSRATFETGKLLSGFRNAQGKETLYITDVFTGFQRDDKRNWFGFHDGVSNLPSKDRSKVIAISRKDVIDKDAWTVSGTYLAFLRMEFDVSGWSKLKVNEQSIIIGRDKITGCPLIGVDRDRRPIKDSRCPIRGTFEVIEKGNEIFREHPPFGNQRYLPRGYSDKELINSHVGKSNPTREQIDRSKSYRIYRQGFEFLEPKQSYPGFRVGLNFISFQKSPRRLFNLLKNTFEKDNAIRNESELPTFEKFFSVRSAGIFLVPPLVTNEPLAGAGIFFDDFSIAKINKSIYQDNLRQRNYRSS